MSNLSKGILVREIFIDVRNETRNATLNLSWYLDRPDYLKGNNLSIAYYYFEVKEKNLSPNLQSMDLELSVNKNWTSENSVENMSVFFFNNASGAWEESSARYLDEDSEYGHYGVSLKSAGYFYIGEITEQSTEKEGISSKMEKWLSPIKISSERALQAIAAFSMSLAAKARSLDMRIKLISGTAVLAVSAFVALEIVRARTRRKIRKVFK